jgi:hypothetical protein
VFIREDWAAFRTLDGLSRKAGVPQDELAGGVVKELVDNGLDAAGDCELLLSDGVLTVQDRGPGIPGDDQDVADLFSLGRAMSSSKFLRRPTRGALGNGLRVVAGAVATTRGKLLVSTNGRTLEIIPDPETGQSTAIRVGDFDGPGTRVELTLGPPLEIVPSDLALAEIAIVAAQSWQKPYRGKTSPHWYGPDSFHELLRSIRSDQMTVRDFIRGQFDGCSALGEIAAEFAGRPARSLKREEAARLLSNAQSIARKVNPERLGAIGEAAFSGSYCREAGSVLLPAETDGLCVELPVVAEVWADPDPKQSSTVFLINGTPTVAAANAWYKAKEKATFVYGCGLGLNVKTGKTGMLIVVHLIVPFMPVTSDGKAPDLELFRDIIGRVLEKAVRRARKQRPAVQDGNIKAIVLNHLEGQVKIVSDHRRYRFHWRQVFYRMRPIVRGALGKELEWAWFCTIITEYEAEHGEEKMAYRDPRGTIYIPHDRISIPLGTLQVEQFERPWLKFNKVLYLEKEGFFEALKAVDWPERHDCLLLTAKGQPTRAARDIIDLISKTDETAQVFCLHDADAAGTIIYQTLQEATKARPRRNIEIINLGLEPSEAVKLAREGIVEIEDIPLAERQARSVAGYVNERWARWLQSHRCELNAFTTVDFIDWLDKKMSKYWGKIVPSDSILKERLKEQVRQQLHESITKRVLEEARIDDQVEEEMATRSKKLADATQDLSDRVAGELDDDPRRHWADVVDARAESIVAEVADDVPY